MKRKEPLPLTPYAIMLVRSLDSDKTIRDRFYVLSRQQHPDRGGANGQPGPLWYELTAAYAAIRTQGVRDAWERQQAMLAGRCAACKGTGVQGRKTIAQCATCGGKGRIR